MSWKWNFIINALGRGGAILVAFVFTPVFVRMMGLEGFSLVAFFLTFLALTFILDFAFGVTMTRELARYSLRPEAADEARDLTRSLEYFYVGVGLLMAAIVVAAAPWITRHWLILRQLSFSEVSHAVMMMGVAIGFQAPLGMYVGALYGLDRQPALNGSQFLLSLLRFGGAALAMALFGATVTVFFLWQVGFSLVQTLVMRHMVWRFLLPGTRPARFNLAVIRGTLHFTSRVTGTAVASFTVNQLDKILLSKLMPLAALGSYQIGNQVGNGAKLLATLVETVVLPRMTIHVEEGDQKALTALYHESCQMVALLVLPFSAVVIFFAAPLVRLWIGNPAVASMAAPVAAVLTLGSACSALVRVPGGLTLAKGWAAFGLYESVISGVLFVPLLIILILHYGQMGAASAWLILNVGYLLIDMPIIHSRLLPGEWKRWLVWDAGIPALICFGLAGSGWHFVSSASPGIAAAWAAAIWLVASVASALAMPQIRQIALLRLRRLTA